MLGDCRCDHKFLVCLLPTDAVGLLGTDFLERTGANVNFECGKIALAAIDKAPRAYEVIPAKGAALTVFMEGDARRSPQPTRREELHTDGHTSDDPRSEVTVSESESWLVKITENITGAPRCRHIVIGKTEVEKGQKPPSLVCVEPAHIPIQGILPGRVLSRVGLTAQQTTKVTSQRTRNKTAARENGVYVMITNFSEESLTIAKSTVIGVPEQVSEAWVNHVNTGKLTKSSVNTNRKGDELRSSLSEVAEWQVKSLA